MTKEAAFEQARIAYEQIMKADEDEANQFWDNLSYEDKCNAFHAVVSRIHQGEIKLRGSYRYVLYDIFGFGPDMYGRGMNCGFMALHNSIMDDEEFSKAHLGRELDHDR